MAAIGGGGSDLRRFLFFRAIHPANHLPTPHSKAILLLRSSQHVGGVERQLLDHAMRLAAIGRFVHVAYLFRGPGQHPAMPAAHAAGISAETIGDAGPLDLAPLRRLVAILTELRPAVVHACDYRTDVFAIFSAYRHWLLLESHGHTRETNATNLWNHLDFWAMRRAASVVAVSAAWETQLAARGVRLEHLHVIGNCTAILASDPPPTPAELPGPGPHLLYAGRQSPEKGLDLILRAWPDVRRHWPGAALWVAGGPAPERRFHSLLAPLLSQPGVQPLGHVADIRPWLQSVSAVVAPSRAEAWGMTVFEALSAGAPVVATRVGGLPDLCRSAPHAHLVSPDLPAALVEGLWRVLQPDFPRGPDLGLAFRSQPRFDPEHRFQRLVALYSA